jgi:hypothetical protein
MQRCYRSFYFSSLASATVIVDLPVGIRMPATTPLKKTRARVGTEKARGRFVGGNSTARLDALATGVRETPAAGR